MSELQLSSSARALLHAARSDAPANAARAKIWDGLAATTGLAATAGAASMVARVAAKSHAAGASTASGVKLMALGALFGSAVTVGLALAVVHVGTRAVPTADVSGASIPQLANVDAPAALVTFDAVSTHTPAAPSAPSHARAALGAESNRRAFAGAASRPPVIREARENSLMREAAFVAEARGSLMRGDAEGALAALRAASSLGSHGLEPEELSLQAHALRLLGRNAEAAAIDSSLKMRYPDHALAR